GFGDPDGDYGRQRRQIEIGKIAPLFGPIERPAGDDAYAVLEYRGKLVATVRLLFAVVG
ncbi:hypothetical protein J3R83DRAFT_11143, partial [Lanmaoa asiatica]